MKKISSLTILALSLSMIAAIPSCNDDEKDDSSDLTPSVVTIDKGLLDAGMTVSKYSNVAELPINCDGEWSITREKEVYWLRILDWDVTFSGKQTLRIAIDENNTGAARTTTLYVSDSAGETQTITIHQQGQTGENGSGQAFSDHGLGCGIDYDYCLNTKGVKARSSASAEPMKFEPTKLHKHNNIFNISMIQYMQRRTDDPLKASAYVESPIRVADLKAVLFDSSVVQSKMLEVSLALDLQFGPIEFHAKGAYTASKDESRAKIDYTIERYCPMYNVYLSPAEIGYFATDVLNNNYDEKRMDAYIKQINAQVASYQKINSYNKNAKVGDDGLTDKQRATIDRMYAQIPDAYDFAGVFSSDFTHSYNQLYRALVNNAEPDYQLADLALESIDDNYGPFFIAGGDWGGSIAMHCEIDTMYLDGKESLSGELAGGMGGMFEVSGEFAYSAKGSDLLRKSKLNLNIYGGDSDMTADRMMAAVTGGNATDLHEWQYILQDWIASMWSESGDTPNQSQAAPISFTLTPIWEVFNDENNVIKKYAEDFFMKKYADRNIEAYRGIAKGEYKYTATELINGIFDKYY